MIKEKVKVPKELIRHFIRGYFDGDGWFTNTEKCFQTGIIGTKEFIEGTFKYLGSCIYLLIYSNILLFIITSNSTNSISCISDLFNLHLLLVKCT